MVYATELFKVITKPKISLDRVFDSIMITKAQIAKAKISFADMFAFNKSFKEAKVTTVDELVLFLENLKGNSMGTLLLNTLKRK